MNPVEWRATSGLALIYILRMLGLFMVLPVLAVYADGMPEVMGWQIGLAVGIYGLTQAILQVPFGAASDRFGRRPVIAIGLLIFALGSLVAAQATTIGVLIAGRALQGAGAIAAVCTALLADLTRESRRTTAMAILGVSIGMAFLMSLMLGPVVSGWIGVPGLFYLAAIFVFVALPILYFWVPLPSSSPASASTSSTGRWVDALRDPQLLVLDVGIFALHAAITALFVAIPLALRDVIGLESHDHWRVYLPVMLMSIAGLPLLLYLSERRQKMSIVFPASIALLAASLLALALGYQNEFWLYAAMTTFFVAFNFLEASLPSMTSRLAPAAIRGAAMGVYSSSQFLGAFVGGAAGGIMLGAFGIGSVLLLAGFFIVGWLALVIGWHPQIATATAD